ncbi:hypothetical protein B0H17DRAFT_1138838 [Mycena rosella]|uniref:Uncharacterized protein n=1 Tax=Mycena rosella TaxID=1033263 RepID=A0AAD7D5L2_MYCRO|nr:hypothetical protein B0H17DRAFT_1138838 [Mycena rosella]
MLASRDADAAEDAYLNLQLHIDTPGSVYVFLQLNERIIGLLPMYPAGTEVDCIDLKSVLFTFGFERCKRNAPSFLVSNARRNIASFTQRELRVDWRELRL